MTPTRRQFIQSAVLMGTPLARRAIAADAAEVSPQRICAFTKGLQSLSFDGLADHIAEIGFDGIEAPVRPGGHIEPERVEDELPRMVDALDRRGLEISVIASGVNRVDGLHTEKVLRTAARLGIKMYRMAYYRYDLKRSIEKQLQALRPIVCELVAMSRELGITPVYQNHSGKTLVGAPIWDIYSLIEDYSPSDIGLAFDLGHATVEGGMSWPVQVNLVRRFVRALYVKDFVWSKGNVKWVPLGEGRTDPSFYRQLQPSGFRGPLSLHVEYDHVPGGRIASHLTALRRDLTQLRSWLDGAS